MYTAWHFKLVNVTHALRQRTRPKLDTIIHQSKFPVSILSVTCSRGTETVQAKANGGGPTNLQKAQGHAWSMDLILPSPHPHLTMPALSAPPANSPSKQPSPNSGKRKISYLCWCSAELNFLDAAVTSSTSKVASVSQPIPGGKSMLMLGYSNNDAPQAPLWPITSSRKSCSAACILCLD